MDKNRQALLDAFSKLIDALSNFEHEMNLDRFARESKVWPNLRASLRNLRRQMEAGLAAYTPSSPS